MKIAYFIARRITESKTKSFSRFIIRLATAATAISVATMIISAAIVTGFKDTIKDKMFVFWGNIEVTPYSPNPSSIITPDPISFNDTLVRKIKSLPQVTAVNAYAVKSAILHAQNGLMEGIKFKGIAAGYPLKTTNAIQFEGKKINFDRQGYSRQIILSQTTLNRLNISIGDTLLAFFIDPGKTFPNIRKLKVAGVFHTGMTDIDQSFAFCDIRLIQRVSNWNGKAINGYQVSIKDYRQSHTIAQKIYQSFLKPPLYTNSMDEIYPNIYNWLALINRNVYIILGIMAIVAVINLSTALLIFIIERTNMVGILKSLGMRNKDLQKIFLYHTGLVALKGIVYGTIGGLLFCFLEQYFHLIPLPEQTYYMKFMPIKIMLWQIVAIDFGTLIFCLLIMTLPAFFVRKINLIKAIQFR